MANFTYKQTKITKLNLKGILDTTRMTIEIDETDKDLSALLADFDGACVQITVNVKEEQELDDPSAM